MNEQWEKERAITMLGNFLSVIDKLELAEWDLHWLVWLVVKNWSMYARRR